MYNNQPRFLAFSTLQTTERVSIIQSSDVDDILGGTGPEQQTSHCIHG